MAHTILVSMLLFSCLMVHLEITNGKEWIVGDEKGWHVGMDQLRWPFWKNFTAGDVLVFRYDPALHSVVKGDNNTYWSCNTWPDQPVYRTGNDHLALQKGMSWFVGGVREDCVKSMRIEIEAK